jgi:hypothetical protein
VIRRLSYVACDECGNPAQPGYGAKEARAIGRYEGFIRRDGRDLCPECADRHGFRHDSGQWEDLSRKPTETSEP